jgi:DNA polymerase (family 10)
MITNAQISNIFRELADLLLQKKEDWFKIRAYRKVADEVEKLTTDIVTLEKEGRLREIPGVGEAIEKKIQEIVVTGNLQLIGRLKAELKEKEVEQSKRGQ